MRSRHVSLALVAALSVPLVAHADTPPFGPAPAESSEGPETPPLYMAGAITFLTSYGLSVGYTASTLERDYRGLYVPVVGPWIALAARTPCDGCEHAAGNHLLLALDGVAQAVGVAMIATSVIEERRARARRRDARLSITPTSIGVVGWF